MPVLLLVLLIGLLPLMCYGAEPCPEHVDMDGDGLCDTCGYCLDGQDGEDPDAPGQPAASEGTEAPEAVSGINSASAILMGIAVLGFVVCGIGLLKKWTM